MTQRVECPECHSEYAKIGNHWHHNPEHRPSLTQEQREIVTGLMMGDGSLNRGNKNPLVGVDMITEEYLEYLDSVFGILGTGVNLKLTAEENAAKKRDSGFRPSADEKNYSDLYTWWTRRHPELHNWDWYGSGQKVWPEDIELTPTVLKHWYCGDGCWDRNHIDIAMANEIDNTEKVSRYFGCAGLPEPSNYKTAERTSGGMKCNATFTVDASHELWDYMGSPLPGFEYKWPEEYHQ